MAKNTDTNVKLQARQLFSLKTKERLSLRFNQHFDESGNAIHIIQCAVIVLVRNFFSEQDFSGVAKSLIRSLFLTREDDLTSVRHLCVYFQPYFSPQEWQTIVSRLFKNQQEYLQVTELARSHMDTLGPVLHSKEQTTDKKRILKAAFEDETGKLHHWSLGNAVRPLTIQDRKAALDILGEVNILQKADGTRKFVRVVKMYFAVDEREHDFNTRDEEDPMFEARDTEEKSVKQTQAKQAVSNKTITASDAAADTSEKDTKSSSKKNAAPNNTDPIGKSASQLARELLKKLPSDHASKLKKPNSQSNKSQPEKNPKIEKALRKNNKKKRKNRKRNKRK